MSSYNDDPHDTHIPTTLVRIQKIDGKLTNEYDVYIGPAIYDLPCSPWWLSCLDECENWPIEDQLEYYKEKVLNNHQLSSQLHTLVGKRLGTFLDPNKPSHGDVLIELAHKYSHQRTYYQTNDGTVLVFKGEKSPLSNFYPSPIRYNDMNFICANHLYFYRHLQDLGKKGAANYMAKLDDLSEIIKYYNSILRKYVKKSKRGSIKKMLRRMRFVIFLKYNQCKELRESLKETEDKILIEGTKSDFWGGGLDIQSIDKFCNNNKFTGRNWIGWTLKWIHFRGIDRINGWHELIAKIEKNKHEFDFNFYKGMKDVHDAIFPAL